MTDLKTAAKQALEALELSNVNHWWGSSSVEKAITALRQALANEALDRMAENARELGLDYEPAQCWKCGDMDAVGHAKCTVPACGMKEQPAQEPEFFTHCVDQPYDWSEWVCPDPKSYLFKCCDCGLVHEAQFGVVRYKSETEREDCDIVDDPNLQAVFRMRRSEQWSPVGTAHRAGGLSMEQPAQQEQVAWPHKWGCRANAFGDCNMGCAVQQPTQAPLTDEQISSIWDSHVVPVFGKNGINPIVFARAIEAAHGIGEKK